VPIFEYRCSDCESKFDILIKNSDDINIFCPDCNSSKVNKLFSAFSTSAGKDSYSYNNCASGNCNAAFPVTGGCEKGMCGLN